MQKEEVKREVVKRKLEIVEKMERRNKM